jgi:hypothetical protein
MRAKEFITEDWNKVNKHDKTNGLSQKAVNAYRREHPGSKLKTAVTTKPSKLKAGSKDAKRRKSFCARMSGNKGPMKKPNGKPTPKALALRRWNCEEGTLNEFAVDHEDGGEENTLHKYARMWYRGDESTQQQVEQILDRMGWEIGEVESEEGGCFVVQSGDEHGKSYIGFAPEDL